MKSIKIVICIDGGNVQSVYSDRPDMPFAIDVIDFDNLKAEGFDCIQRYRIMEESIKHLTLVKN